MAVQPRAASRTRDTVEGRACMRAPRLRAGLVLFVGVAVLLGTLLGPAPAVAQEEDLQAALDDYAAGRYEEALEKLRTYVATNPGNDEVYAVLRDADEQVLLRALAKEGEHERLLKYLLSKARPVARERRIDPDELQELVYTAVNDESLDRRREAAIKLTAAGPLAVPALSAYLARSDANVVVNTMLALHRLGFAATAPLCELLEHESPRVRANTAAVLGDIRDALAAPALLRLKEKDEDENVRAKAVAALQKMGGVRAASIKAANAYTRLGERFLANDPTLVMDYGNMRDIWRFEDGSLVRYAVPAWLYPYQMAEEAALDALDLDPGNMSARSLLVLALLGQKVEADVVTTAGGEAPEILGSVFDVAVSQGFDAATEALRQSLKNRDWDLAMEAMHLVEATYGNQPLGNHPLDAALKAPEKRVAYEAAITLLRMSPSCRLANAKDVASLAARAASEQAERQILVIDDKHVTRSRLLMDLAHAGYVSAATEHGAKGVSMAKMTPTLDVVIVRADLGDADDVIPSKRLLSSTMVIDELKHDVRTKDVRIVVLLEETLEAKVDALKEFFTEKYGDDLAGILTVPLDTTSAMEIVAEAAEASDLNPGRERANALAARAADAFAQTDFGCATFDLSIAVEPLAAAALEGPTAEVKLAAVKALGNIRKGGIDQLAEILSGDGEEELRAAAAAALGSVLSVMDGKPEAVDALIAAADGEGAVAEAALRALGSVKMMTPEQRREVFRAHRLAVAEPASS